MPASYVHQCIAAKACDSLSLFSSSALRSAALAGAEGPDPLFFSVLTPSAPLLGSVLHTRKTDEFMLALADACADNELTQAYCCGFFSHYAADTTIHPFIYAQSLTPEGSYSSTQHCTLEHQIETLHFRRIAAAGLPVQMAGFSALSKGNKDLIARALTKAIQSVFPGESIPYARVRASFEDSVMLCNLLRSERGIKFSLLGGILRPFHLDAPLHAHMMPKEPPAHDIANAGHHPWRSLWAPDIVRHDSFDDLFDQAVLRSAQLMQAAYDYMRGQSAYATLRTLHGGFSFDSGLPWATTCSAREAAARIR